MPGATGPPRRRAAAVLGVAALLALAATLLLAGAQSPRHPDVDRDREVVASLRKDAAATRDPEARRLANEKADFLERGVREREAALKPAPVAKETPQFFPTPAATDKMLRFPDSEIHERGGLPRGTCMRTGSNVWSGRVADGSPRIVFAGETCDEPSVGMLVVVTLDNEGTPIHVEELPISSVLGPVRIESEEKGKLKLSYRDGGIITFNLESRRFEP